MTTGDGLIEALHAGGPAGEHSEELMLFGRFVGSWRLAWRGTGADGEPATQSGELHFGWVLGGRAVQDVWIVPGRGEPGEGRPPLAFHGSTIRFYDPAIGAWRSTWIEPVNGRVRRFIGRPVDGDIVLVSDEDDPHLRWRFTDITPDSFRWRSETSRDGGATWEPDEEMLATRVDSTRDPDIRQIAARLREADSLDAAELRELSPSLLILEALAVRESPPFDAAAIAELRAANRRLRDSAGDPAAAALADDAFHRRLTAGCSNERVLEVIDGARRAMLAYERVYMLSRERLERSVAEHEAIVSALERGDHARAAELVRENFTTGMPEVEAQLRERSDD